MHTTKTNTSNNIISKSLVFLVSSVILASTFSIIFGGINSKAQSTGTSTPTTSSSTLVTNPGSPAPVTGTGKAGNTISVTFPDGTTATTTVKSDGTYVIMPLTTQPAGTITITELAPNGTVVTPAKTLPYAGGNSIPSTALTPKLSIKDPYVCPGKVTGSIDNNKATVVIEISKSGSVVLTLTPVVNANGSWAIDLQNKLSDGAYSLKFTGTYNGMIASGTYDFMHKNVCTSNSTSSTIRTGGINLVASIATLSALVIGIYFLLIKKFSK